MRFSATDSTFTAINDSSGIVQSANILGVKETDGGKKYFLDRLLEVRENQIPEGWALGGVVSTIATISQSTNG